MTKLVIIGPNTVKFEGCIADNVRKVMCAYINNTDYNITTILTIDTFGVPEIARCYSKERDLCLKVYPTNGNIRLSRIFRQMILDGDMVIIFAYNPSACVVIKLVDYAIRNRKSVNVIPLIF